MAEPDPGNLYTPPPDGDHPDTLDTGERLTGGDFVAELTTSTTDPRRPPAPPETPEAVSIVEAVAGWEVARRTLRRRLADGDVDGAYKVPGPKGAEWRIPPAALDALGYRRRTPDAPPAPPTPPPTLDPTPAERLADKLADLLDGERKALAAARQDWATAREEAARHKAEADVLREQLEKAEARAEKLAADLDAARTPRRWRKRKA